MFLESARRAAHHPLQMKETPFSRPSGSPVASVGKPSCSAGLTRYLGRETLIKYWLTPHARHLLQRGEPPQRSGSSTRGTRARQWLPYTPTPLHPYTPTPLCFLKGYASTKHVWRIQPVCSLVSELILKLFDTSLGVNLIGIDQRMLLRSQFSW